MISRRRSCRRRATEFRQMFSILHDLHGKFYMHTPCISHVEYLHTLFQMRGADGEMILNGAQNEQRVMSMSEPPMVRYPACLADGYNGNCNQPLTEACFKTSRNQPRRRGTSWITHAASRMMGSGYWIECIDRLFWRQMYNTQLPFIRSLRLSIGVP